MDTNNFLGGSIFGFNSKENTTSIIAWVSVYNIGLLIMIFTYIFLFMIPQFTGFFTPAKNQIENLPLLAWHIPSFVSFVMGIVFGQDPNESYTLPLCILNFLGFVCYLVCVVITLYSISLCAVSDTVVCGIMDIFTLSISTFIFLILIILEFSLIFAYLRYSISVSDIVDNIIYRAKLLNKKNEETMNNRETMEMNEVESDNELQDYKET